MEDKEKNTGERFNAFIKLCLWGIFIVFILLISSLGSNKENNVNEEVLVTYKEKLNKITNNFKFNYEIKVNNEVYNFSGSKLVDKEVGTFVYNGESTNYYIENNKVYIIENKELKEIEDFYKNLDKDIFDINKIKEAIKDKEYVKINDKYVYTLENNKTINIYSNDQNITKIEIFIASDYYKLEFNDIGLIKEINY